MKINQSIITLIILFTVSSITIGCASKLTEEQALAKSQLTEEQALAKSQLTEEQALSESQALSDRIKNLFSRNPNLPGRPNLSKIDLPATKRVGNKNLRLVLLSHKASLRWLGEAGFKFHKNDHGITKYRKARNMTSRGFRSRSGYGRVDDPQYIYFNNLPVMITGGGYTRDPQVGEEILYIFDQYDDVRVVTYEQY